jgi:hypothetical protein
VERSEPQIRVQILTGNVSDFYLFDEVLPGSPVRLYRAA